MQNLLHYTTHLADPNADWMIFIHGAGGSSLTWKYQIEGFAPHYNLLLIDMRDHGYSKDLVPKYRTYNFDIITDDLLRAIDHAGVTTAHFIALSLGSIILQKLSDRRPGMMKTMIMCGGVFKADWRISTFAHFGKFLSYFVPFRWIYDGFILIVMPRRNHAFSRKQYRKQSLKLKPGEFLKWLGLYKDFFSVVRKFFNTKLITPSLLVNGSQDHVFLDAAKRYANKHAPLAELVVMEGKGHLCNLEDRKMFNKIVLDWLDGADAISSKASVVNDD
ncbi:alpha/beta fold hydrolase [Neolewinella persica]|uniref:alpha/beta fold hydrolase n=1 Tax=Neolewinella persica TaxID=70998 RepID=UPI00037F966E|nr:alpha/beta hydrolase [Neolewinella persica]